MIISNERCWLQYQIAIDDLSDFNYSIFQNSLPSVERFQAQLNPVVYFLTSVLFFASSCRRDSWSGSEIKITFIFHITCRFAFSHDNHGRRKGKQKKSFLSIKRLISIIFYHSAASKRQHSALARTSFALNRVFRSLCMRNVMHNLLRRIQLLLEGDGWDPEEAENDQSKNSLLYVNLSPRLGLFFVEGSTRNFFSAKGYFPIGHFPVLQARIVWALYGECKKLKFQDGRRTSIFVLVETGCCSSLGNSESCSLILMVLRSVDHRNMVNFMEN